MQQQEECLNESLSLHGKWDLYYHLPHDKQWDLNSYKFIAKNIDCLDTLIALNETIPEKIIKHCMLFVMKSGITPMWEDKENRDGGCFSFKVANKQVYDKDQEALYIKDKILLNKLAYILVFLGMKERK